MKHEWKTAEKHIYLPKQAPEVITLPSYQYITITGAGNPNSADFAEHVGALYSLAYTIKMMPKKGVTPEGYFDYTVYPLEGVWDLSEKGRTSAILDKDELIYKIMIRQPEFVSRELFGLAVNSTLAKKDASPLLTKITFEDIEDGLCVQMLHVGTFDSEPASFSVMDAFCAANNFRRRNMLHREMYISDFQRTAPEKLRTVLRYFVEV